MRSAIVIIALLGLALPAHANGPEIGFDGGSAVPLRSTSIRLVRESVILRLPGIDSWSEDGSFECVYLLRNDTATDQDTWMSFIGPTTFPEGLTREFLSAGQLSVLINGLKSPIRWAAPDTATWKKVAWSVPDSVPTWRLSVPARDSVSVQIASKLNWSGGCGDGDCSREIRYVATPARLWKGQIEFAEITIVVGELATGLLRAAKRDPRDVRVEIEPRSFAWTPQGIRWRFRNWEPTEDILLRVNWKEESLEDN